MARLDDVVLDTVGPLLAGGPQPGLSAHRGLGGAQPSTTGRIAGAPARSHRPTPSAPTWPPQLHGWRPISPPAAALSGHGRGQARTTPLRRLSGAAEMAEHWQATLVSIGPLRPHQRGPQVWVTGPMASSCWPDLMTDPKGRRRGQPQGQPNGQPNGPPRTRLSPAASATRTAGPTHALKDNPSMVTKKTQGPRPRSGSPARPQGPRQTRRRVSTPRPRA